MQLKTEDIIVGSTIYVACSQQGWVEELKVCSRPVTFDIAGVPCSWILAVNPTNLDKTFIAYADSFFRSLQDMGIVPNKYNQHRTFDNRIEAEKYAGIYKCPTCGK